MCDDKKGPKRPLDPAVVSESEGQLQWLTAQRRPRDAEDAAELLRLLGDLSPADLVDRGVDPAWMAALSSSRRAIQIRVAGEERWIGVEDAGRYRDALGAALPVGVPEAYLEPLSDPLGDLVARYARTHGPFAAATCAAHEGAVRVGACGHCNYPGPPFWHAWGSCHRQPTTR